MNTTLKTCKKHPDRMTQSGCTGIVSVTPSTGWFAEWDTDEGEECSEPLVGWGVQCNGEVVPLEVDVDGMVTELLAGALCVYRGPRCKHATVQRRPREVKVPALPEPMSGAPAANASDVPASAGWVIDGQFVKDGDMDPEELALRLEDLE
ncbi:hypothetical protein GCM10023160_18760 [Brachybacterium paraconglomeratum]|uniref:hypothetical protein n=1 Tax=Brachybacterium paraconglomeratum TaxID=173362 RepID=UPI0031E9E21F